MIKTPPRHANISSVALTAWAISFVVLLVQQWWFVKSGFLFHDDGVIIPSTIFLGDARITKHPFLWYMSVLDLLRSFPIERETALTVFKIFVLVLFACVPALMAALLLLVTNAPWLSLVTALFFAGYPLAADQGATYVAAAHPTYGSMVAIATLGVFWFSWRARAPKFLIGIIMVAVLAYLASFASPTLRLMVVAPALWVVVMSIFDWRGWKRPAIALVILLLPLALRATTLTEHQYAHIPGRVDISASTMLGNALSAAEMTLAPLTGASRAVLLLYVAGFILLAFALYRANRATPADQEPGRSTRGDIGLFLGLCVLTAALSFGPPSVLTVFRPRYVVPAFLLIGLGIGTIVVWYLCKQGSSGGARLALAALALLAVANVIRTGEMQDREFGRARLTHEATLKLVTREKDRWGKDAQVVLLVSRRQRTPTGGMLQRSTGYLRHLTGRDIKMGLIGRVDRLGADPFVEDSSKIRKPLYMQGIEQAPLYVYEADKIGSQIPSAGCPVLRK